MLNTKFLISNLKLLLIFIVFLILIACNSPANNLPLEDQLREYFYKYQPTTGAQFVEWASQNLLANYSPRQIYLALQNEARSQAQSGHPNVVGVLSFATRSWAEKNNFQYDANQWLTLQQEAMSNLRPTPEKLQLWPEE